MNDRRWVKAPVRSNSETIIRSRRVEEYERLPIRNSETKKVVTAEKQKIVSDRNWHEVVMCSVGIARKQKK